MATIGLLTGGVVGATVASTTAATAGTIAATTAGALAASKKLGRDKVKGLNTESAKATADRVRALKAAQQGLSATLLTRQSDLGNTTSAKTGSPPLFASESNKRSSIG